jgi:predicted O-methyltransferase YrrM
MPDPLLSTEISKYLDDLVPARHPVLAEMEEVARKTDFPIIGPSCGHFCYLLARLIGARQIFELGSGYGYSTAWFARAVKENGGGTVHHVVWDEKPPRGAGVSRPDEADDVVTFHMGEAVATLKEQAGRSTSSSTTSTRKAIPRRSA